MSELAKLLNHAKSNGSIVAVYSDIDDPEGCSLGIVMVCEDEILILKSITKHGFDDGWVVRRISDIYRVDVDGQYERAIAHLWQEHVGKEKIEDTSILDKRDFFDVLQWAKDNHGVVSIWTQNGAQIVGFISSASIDIVNIQALDSYGYADGDIAVKLELVIAINVAGIDELRLKALAKTSPTK